MTYSELPIIENPTPDSLNYIIILAFIVKESYSSTDVYFILKVAFSGTK